ncbi:MAG: bifunctional UDP-N-acetylglucosamine diphosphorylase/glucosamine-1-phosphate N-acetyltransferase GlmU [Thermoleophilia bacterium]|nr:bifunctional UDP-N-acetylglucosamine diphosphorylase/glucosamine-1-phosphate N-acetyltransferase GlmU [Thermoleophilia bacterium]
MHSVPAKKSRRALAVIVLAAGLGTRMKSKIPKVLHTICGRPMIEWINRTAAAVSPDRLLVVLGPGLDDAHQFLPQNAQVIIQEEQLGTGDAVRSCQDALAGFDGDIVIMYGDTPLVTGEELGELLAVHTRSNPACTVMTVEMEDPGHYGRVCRDADGRVTRIVEHRDATEEEMRICEVNAGVYAFESASLWEALAEVGSDNVQGEVYLTDVIGILSNRSLVVLVHRVEDANVTLGVNSRLDLARVEAIMRRRIIDRHMIEGVTVRDPDSTYVDADVKIGSDTVLEPLTRLVGKTVVGEDCLIGPSTTLIDSAVDDGATVVFSHAAGAEIGAGCSVGPFASLRPGARLAPGAKAGTFVEIKNSLIGAKAKVPHLSYVGDAEVGEGTNIGAGNITANYDGVRKHRTVIGRRVNTGAATTFVAPVTVGNDSMTGAGSVINNDVPEGALGIARSRQRNIADYARKKFRPRQDRETGRSEE